MSGELARGVDLSDRSPQTSNSIQNMTHALHEHVIDLTKAGTFAGRHSARAQFDFYCQRTGANSDGSRRRGWVMSGCTPTAVVAQAIGVDRKTVQRNDKWLHENGLIHLKRLPDGQQSIRIMTWDELSEADRQANAGTHVYPYAAIRTELARCEYCQLAFQPPRVNARYCSESCKQKAKRARRQSGLAPDLPSGSDTDSGQDVAPPATRDTDNDTDSGQDVAHTLRSSHSDLYRKNKSASLGRREEIGEEGMSAARPVAAAPGRYVNDFWVQAEGRNAGFFTKMSSRPKRYGEALVSLTPSEAVEFWKRLSRTDREYFMLAKVQDQVRTTRPLSRPRAGIRAETGGSHAWEPEDDSASQSAGPGEASPRWYVDHTNGSYRPVAGRARPRSGEEAFEGAEDELLARWPYLTIAA